MFLLKIKNYLIIIIILIISYFFLTSSCKLDNINNNYKLVHYEQILLNRSLINNIKINKKIILLDLTSDIKNIKKNNDTTDDILGSGNYIYDVNDLNRFNQNIDIFYEFIKKDLEDGLKEINLNNEILFNTDLNNTKSDQTIIFIDIIEYFEGEYNLIKNELTKFKISVKLFRKDLINNNNLLFIKKYKCKPSILFPTEKLRILEIANLCSRDIIDFFKKNSN